MDIISLDLNRQIKPDESLLSAGELIEQLQVLIRGIAFHAIESPAEEAAELRRQMAAVADELNSESSADDLLVAIGRTLRLIEEYNRRAAVIFKGQIEELRGMLATMTETVQFIVSSSETSVKQLSFVETQLQRASGLEDLRQLKTYTLSCLSLVRRESTRLQSETKEKVEALKNDVERLSIRLKAAVVEESEDSVTGLPGRAAAEQVIEEKVAAGKTFAAALFLMDRMEAINGRFGHSVGDEIVMSCAQMLAKDLRGATLYRWSGPGFLAIFDTSVGIGEAENRAKHAAAQKLEKNVDAGERVLMVVVSVSCHVQQISVKSTPDDLFRRMDGFMVAGQG
jgi:diguanylate cyclase (GGDEF)-like protein